MSRQRVHGSNAERQRAYRQRKRNATVASVTLPGGDGASVVIGDAREFTPAWFGQRFGVILADPPWSYDFSRVQGCAENHYPVLSIEELRRIPVAEVAKRDAALLLWGTWPKLPEALSLAAAWGFQYVTGMPWVKTEKSGALCYGIGHWVRGCSEYVLVCKRGNVRPPSRAGFAGLLSPNLVHSRKPKDIHQYAESMPGPYLELFAREARPGWVCFGNEVEAWARALEVQDEADD